MIFLSDGIDRGDGMGENEGSFEDRGREGIRSRGGWRNKGGKVGSFTNLTFLGLKGSQKKILRH